ncbi:MAG: hypothetical protein K0Q83_1875, partial [Deltaproteobacteria bacterium]|nr:hypothetical protein [Deltaproteobacteria bacterium]
MNKWQHSVRLREARTQPMPGSQLAMPAALTQREAEIVPSIAVSTASMGSAPQRLGDAPPIDRSGEPGCISQTLHVIRLPTAHAEIVGYHPGTGLQLAHQHRPETQVGCRIEVHGNHACR